MGTSGVVLKNREAFQEETLLSDVIKVAFRKNMYLSFGGYVKRNSNGSFRHTMLNIASKPPYIEETTQQFIFNIWCIENKSINETEFDWVEKDKKLYNIACIEEVYGAEELAFHFVYEYLKLNPNDYFWFDSYEWVFSLKDMEKLNALPYDSNWCYKNPKLIP
jgi:hypothetical protein